MVLFLAGAFSFGLYVAKVGREKPLAYTVPIMLIVVIVLSVALFGQHHSHLLFETEYFTGSLLFAMGMQNALVSIVSGSEVRTTHLTGMFTGLGIDLSVALLVRNRLTGVLKRRILLRMVIIVFFLLGGLAGGLCFLHMQFNAFFISAGLLLIALFYDYFWIKVKRVIVHHRIN